MTTEPRYRIEFIRRDGTSKKTEHAKLRRVADQRFREAAAELAAADLTGPGDYAVEVALYDGDDLIDTTSKCVDCGKFESLDALVIVNGRQMCRGCFDGDISAAERLRERLDAEAAAGYNRFTAPEVEPPAHDDNYRCPNCDPGPPIVWSEDHIFTPGGRDPLRCAYCDQLVGGHDTLTLRCDVAAIEAMDNEPMYFNDATCCRCGEAHSAAGELVNVVGEGTVCIGCIAREDAGEDDAPGMTPAAIAFANLDRYMVTRGVQQFWGPDTDVAAVYASAAIAYELRAIRELLSAPAVFLSPGATAEGVFEARERWEREYGRTLTWPQVIKI